MDKTKLRDKIEELEQRYKVIAENLVDALWVMDLETLAFDYMTPSLELISGFTPEEYARLSPRERMTGESWQNITAALREMKSQYLAGAVRRLNLDLEMIHRDGHTYWIEVTGRLFQSEDGRLKVAGVSKNITIRKKAEMDREQLIEELNRTLAEKEILLKENKVLRGLLPICAGCRRIRDEDGKWWPLDAYVEKHSQVNLSHTICPDCKEVYYGRHTK